MIVLITPTGARVEQFRLCAKWMQNQTYSGHVLWIIVDDAYPISTNNVTEDFRAGWEIIKVYPTPSWSGQNTQARNIKAGIDALLNYKAKEKIELVFIIEDDDYYKPIYVSRMIELKQNFQLIGETRTVYYNVVTRRYVINPNITHASLFQTAFTMNVIPIFAECYFHKFIDCVLWTKVPNHLLFYDNCLSIGIKGMAGRGGIGAGHLRQMNMTQDNDWIYLKRLIGEQDAKEYFGYYSDYSEPQHRLFAKRGL